MSNILPKDSSKVIYMQKLIVSKKFDNLANITLRVTETGPSRIKRHLQTGKNLMGVDNKVLSSLSIFNRP